MPHTKYHESVPILIGTNIIHPFTQSASSDEGFSQGVLSTAWEVARRSIVFYEKQMRRTNGDIGVVKSASRETIALQSNQTLTLVGAAKIIHCQKQIAMVQHSDKSILQDGVEICPALVNMKQTEIPVTLSNLSQETVVIPPSAILCQLKAVDVEEMPQEIEEEMTDQVKVDLTSTKTNLSTEQFKYFTEKLDKWNSLFAKDDMDLGHMDAVKHKIKLNNTAI